MQHVNTHSYWTITTVCRYRDNDVSLFSLFVAATIDGAARATHRQHHLVDVTRSLTPQRQLESRRSVEPVVNNSVSLKTLRDKSTSGYRTLGGIRLCGCIEPDMGTFAAGNLKKKKHSPGQNKNRAAPVTWNLHNTDISPPLRPTFDLWSLSRRQRFPLPDTSFFFCMFLISLPLPFHVAHASRWGAWTAPWRDATVQTHCGSLKTSCWLGGGKRSRSSLLLLRVCPLNPHWPDHISAEAGNHRTSVVNHMHNTISICHFFPAQRSVAGTVPNAAPGCR